MCQDRPENFLKDYLYNAIFPPSEKYHPLDLLFRDNDTLKWRGKISSGIIENQPSPPPISPDLVNSDFGSLKTRDVGMTLGITLLKGLFQSLGAADLGASLEATFKNTKSLQFAFKEVVSNVIDEIELADYFTMVTAKTTNPIIHNMIDGRGKYFLIKEIIKTKSIDIVAKSDGSGGVNLDVNAIKQLLEVKAGVNVSIVSSDTIHFSGEKSLVFGIKAFPLWVEVTNGKARFISDWETEAEPDITVRMAPPLPITSRVIPNYVVFNEKNLISIGE